MIRFKWHFNSISMAHVACSAVGWVVSTLCISSRMKNEYDEISAFALSNDGVLLLQRIEYTEQQTKYTQNEERGVHKRISFIS